MTLYDGSNAPTITVEFDTSKIGSFVLGISQLGGSDVLTAGGAGTTWTSIPTTDIRAISIRRGRTREDQANQPGSLTLTLDNRSYNYDPDNPSSTFIWNGYSILSAGMGVRVSATWSGTTYVIYRGYLEQLDVDETLDPVATFQFTDALAWIGRLNVAQISSSYSGDTTATRVGRILDAVGWDASLRNLTGSRTMQPTTMGSSALSLSEQAARCEFGRFYADRQGKLVLLPYESTFTTPNRISLSDTRATGTIEYDNIATNPGAKYLVNTITIQQTSSLSQTYADTVSIARYGVFAKSYDAPLLVDADAYTLATIIGDRFDLPKTRVDSVEFDALGVGDQWVQLLQTDLGDNVSVQRTTVDNRTRVFTSLVESLNHDITPSNWRVSMDLSPSTGGEYFILGSSLLGGTNVLYY